MIIKTVAIYTFFDGMLKSVEHKEPVNRKTTDAEVITVILLASAYFGGNIETSISFVHSAGMMPRMLSKSRFNRRMHRTGELLTELFLYTGESVKTLNISSTYCIAGFPAAVYRNIRIPRCRTVKTLPKDFTTKRNLMEITNSDNLRHSPFYITITYQFKSSHAKKMNSNIQIYNDFKELFFIF